MTNWKRLKKETSPMEASLMDSIKAMTRRSQTGMELSLDQLTLTSTIVSTCYSSFVVTSTQFNPHKWGSCLRSTSPLLTNKMEESISIKMHSLNNGTPKEMLTRWSTSSSPLNRKWLQTRNYHSLLMATCMPESKADCWQIIWAINL